MKSAALSLIGPASFPISLSRGQVLENSLLILLLAITVAHYKREHPANIQKQNLHDCFLTCFLFVNWSLVLLLWVL